MTKTGSRSLRDLARAIGGRVVGDESVEVAGVRGLVEAGPRELAAIARSGYLDEARSSAAGAFLVGEDLEESTRRAVGGDRPLMLVADPVRSLGQVIEIFHPRVRPSAGRHPTAVVEEGARVDASAHLGPYAVVGADARVGSRCVIHAHAVVGAGCELGPEVVLHPHVVLYPSCRLGRGVEVHAGTVLGADGFGYASVDGVHHKVPQVGRVEIGEDCEIGALSAVDRATLESTVIGPGSKIDNLVQVGHNSRLGRGCILCGQAGVAGSARLGDHVVLGGQSGTAGHLVVGDRTQVAAKSAVLQSTEPGEVVAGIPARDIKRWRREQLLTGRLRELWQRVRRLEKDRE